MVKSEASKKSKIDEDHKERLKKSIEKKKIKLHTYKVKIEKMKNDADKIERGIISTQNLLGGKK